ncbi:MAG: oligosaccharide flippase family protein, partial [Pyrinomonadaceae bacterium]
MERVDHSARSSFAANIAFNLLSWGAPLAIAFVVTPILIRGLGLDGYGYYSFVLAVIGFAFTTGIGRMSAKYIPEERIGKADGQLAKLLSASLYITIAVAAVQGLLIAALAPLLVSEVLLAPQSVQAGLISAIRIACLIGPVLMLSQVFQSATQGLHRFRAFAIITLSAAIFLNAGVIVLVLSGYDIAALFWWNLAVTAIAAVVFALFVLPRVPEFRPMMPDSAAFAKVLRFASSIFIYQSIYSVFCIFERILVVRKFGAEAMTFYAVPLMLGIYLH